MSGWGGGGGGGGGGGAPTNASYIVIGLNATLTNERRLQVSGGLSLTDGGANGDATIDGTNAGAASVTAGEAMNLGSVVYVSGNNTVSKGDQSVAAKSRVIGVVLATAALSDPVNMKTKGKVTARMVGSLTLAAGDKVLLSTDGRGTNVAPSTGRQVILGTVLDASGYSGGAGDPTAILALDIHEPVILG